VVGSSANVAVVYGTGSGVSSLDLVQAGNIQSNLQSYMGASTGSSSVSTSGETVSLDTSADRIWLNTSLNAIKSTITKSDLPTVLADYSFSGDTTSKVISTIKLIAGNPTGVENSGKVIFAKQPESSDDPTIAVSVGTAQNTYPLYNASATMSAINFTHADSEGGEIELFGQTFTIAAETDLTKLVLLKDAEKISLTVPSNPSATVTVGGSEYTIRLITASSTSANIEVTNSAGVSAVKEVTEAASKRINGVDVAVTTATSSSLESVGESASIIVGSQKLTITNTEVVTVGEDDDPIDGTYAYITGGVNASTEIAIAVFRPDSTSDAILPGESFVDPVFGSFKVDFAGLSSNLDDAGREMISVQNSGDATMSITMGDSEGNSKTFDFAHNESNTWRLADNGNFSIAVREMANLSYAAGKTKYVVVGNEDYGHMLELYQVSNSSGSITNDVVKFRDVMSGETYETSFSSTEGTGTLDVDGKRYTVTFLGTGEDASVRIKYPSTESGVGEYILFPTIETANGGLVSLYEPQTLTLTDMDGASTTVSSLWLPDGDGYNEDTVTYSGGNATYANWTIGGTKISTPTIYGAYYEIADSQLEVGQIAYNVTATSTVNVTSISLIDPESTAKIAEPSIVLFEGKDDDTYYHAVVVQTEPSAASMGTSTNGVGVNDVLFSSDKYHASATRSSDSDFTEDIDWYGTLVVTDASDSDQKSVEISLPKSQVYAQLYLGEIASSVAGSSSSTAGAQLGDVLVKDSEVSSVSSKNLVVVGGSCINSVAANLLGAACGADFTEKTGVGSGQFLIQSIASPYSTGKVALVVAGFEAADTVNAATYLRTQTVDTTAGKKYKGSSATSAELMVA
jgi:hypothetical protein